ncbi:2-C-methyl-D-erythritol 4-phosphate cytidylyltransferase [Sphingobacterium sp. lm-10]|uniref:2-C-methyl-D-erythritol 4-phosphate cytidylyltransferase n=1 Tax=Sphingobacterium sp. lm-10 TaxID=2944904 RepID=UPI00201FB5DF|nr:2-C-methyl-D-erythritol 4-phosphate cytidylyltransferase [Sphingobacterium sp. lm-10]MCL7986786.1 2-C-methyl-D-erythritol 4-phosphate cytidylyltransferase [Sphingobacterium sp. lm-10]
MSKKFVVIVAGGVGSRMNSTLPKQFHLLGDRPVLMHTLSRFEQANLGLEIVVVLSASMLSYWAELCEKYHFNVAHHIVTGGATRFQSVKYGLNFLKNNLMDLEQINDVLIAIHDGARPILSSSLLERLFTQAKEVAAVVPAVRSTNSIRIGNLGESESVDRNLVWQIQTPQVFKAELLFSAYEQEEEPNFTDDASAVEKMGNIISIVEGDHFNLKITHPEDLDIAQIYLDKLFN